MTRVEQAAENVRKRRARLAAIEAAFKAKMAEERAETHAAEAVQREVDRKANRKKRAHWGALVDEAGLFVWDANDFAAVCAMLKRYLPVTNPAPVLEALLRRTHGSREGMSRASDSDRTETTPPVSAEVTVG
jgi:transcription termination factor NusB